MANRTRDIKYFYPKPESTGYSEELSDKRFSVLKNLKFKSILDVGSGCCNLNKWLFKNRIECKYDAVDIREDALALCDCDKYLKIPKRKKYDTVCLFGTVTYNIDQDIAKNKNILDNLLDEAFISARKYMVFSVLKDEKLFGLSKLQLVGYEKREIESIASRYGNFKIDEAKDENEYIAIIEVKKEKNAR